MAVVAGILGIVLFIAFVLALYTGIVYGLWYLVTTAFDVPEPTLWASFVVALILMFLSSVLGEGLRD